VRAIFQNKDHALTDGQTLRVVLETRRRRPPSSVPQGRRRHRQTGTLPVRGQRQNVVEQRRVRRGFPATALLVIDEGLKAGEKVIIQGPQKVRAGMTVTPTAAPRAEGLGA